MSAPRTRELQPAVAPAATVPGASSPPRPKPQPLGAERYRVTFTAGPETHARLEEAQALQRHQIPDGDLAKLFDRALEALLREVRRTKFAETEHPRAPRAGAGSRHIPAAIKRTVSERDHGCCTFVAPDGRRCSSREALEFHHLQPFARSPRHHAQEITLRCRAHNRHAAIQDYGAAHMPRFRKQPVAG